MYREILIKCWDWNRDASPDYACENNGIIKKKYKSKKNCGKLFIRYVNIIKKYSFTSFLSGDNKSLHYMGPPNYESQHMKVIKSRCSIRTT